MADLVVIGAGPVGLWTALQVKLRRPEWDVVLYERSETYVRSHVLRLDHWSLMLYGRHKPSVHGDVRRRLYDDIVGKQLSRLALQPAASLFIRTNELEQALRTHALAMGVRIEYRRIETPAEAEALHPECRRFVAADGARSGMRRALLGDSDIVDKPLRRVVEVKYEARGTGQRLAVFGEQLKANRKLTHMAFEYVGKVRDGIAPVTLRFFVDEAAYEALGNATFRDPLSLDDPRIPHSLRDDVLAYMRHRVGHGQEAVCRLSAKLTKLTLSMYHAREFAISTPGGCWFLVGDAAMGVPYFRALNSGMILASRLAQILCARSWPISEKLHRQKSFYLFHQSLHWRTEFAIARGKDALLSGYDWARQLAWGGVVTTEANDMDPEGFLHALDLDCRQD